MRTQGQPALKELAPTVTPPNPGPCPQPPHPVEIEATGFQRSFYPLLVC